MPKFVIEREIPGIGRLPADSMRTLSKKSCEVLEKMGPSIQWVESFVTNDKLYCVYIAPDEADTWERAAPLWQSYAGLERYWRKREEAAA